MREPLVFFRMLFVNSECWRSFLNPEPLYFLETGWRKGRIFGIRRIPFVVSLLNLGIWRNSLQNVWFPVYHRCKVWIFGGIIQLWTDSFVHSLWHLGVWQGFHYWKEFLCISLGNPKGDMRFAHNSLVIDEEYSKIS